MNENGLILKDKIINRISGPVSMYYLTPSLRELHNYKEENIDLPLIILFGDHHYSRENMCPNCDCDEKSCCYEIYHTDFLKELDKIAKSFPIDFYTEFSPTRINAYQNSSSGILFYNFIQHTIKDCHNVPLRSLPNYKQKCPTQYIRWHYTDTRWLNNVIEGYILSSFYTYINIWPTKRLNIEDIIKGYTQWKVNQRSRFSSLDNQGKEITIKILNTLFDDFTSDIILINLVNVIIDSILLKSNQGVKSAIIKQINKLQSQKLQNIKLWKEIAIQSLSEAPKLTSNLSHLKKIPNQQSLKLFFISILNNDLSDISSLESIHKTNLLKTIIYTSSLLGTLNTILLDLYCVLRMLKNPDNNIHPILSLGFFGDTHTRSIVKILSHPLINYNIQIIKQPKNNVSRCITFSDKINLYNDIIQHARFLYSNNPQKLKLYQNQIYKEQKSRHPNKNIPNWNTTWNWNKMNFIPKNNKTHKNKNKKPILPLPNNNNKNKKPILPLPAINNNNNSMYGY